MMTAPQQPLLRGELRVNESLKRYNTWRVGGPAKQMYLPADVDDLGEFLRSLPANEKLLWLGLGSNFTVAMGILGAGIAFASQEVIGSFAGYLNIVTGGIYHIGDRVRIGNVVGDVMDIGILRTTVMEIGEWAESGKALLRLVASLLGVTDRDSALARQKAARA